MTLAVAYAGPTSPLLTEPGCLGVVGFAAARPAVLPSACPFLELPLVALSCKPPRVEIWLADGPAERADADGLRLSMAGPFMFGVLEVERRADQAFDALAGAAYARIFAAAEAAGRPHLLRVFQYFPRITALEGGTQRYHAFNAGRHAAFVTAGRSVSAAPAACALGILGEGSADRLRLYFLAGAEPGEPVENARQVSAYLYPPAHGPRSPTFSRAMIVGGTLLLVSGTASIVGHESLHVGDIAAQTDEILRNFGALDEAVGRRGKRPEVWRLKVYLRHPEDRAMVAERLVKSALSVEAEPLYLQAEICRDELLVEIEATARLAPA